MAEKTKKTTVKGGWVTREARTGKFHSVHSEKGTDRASAMSETVAKEASSKRSAALKRLADR